MPKVLIIEDAVELAEVIQATLEAMDIEAFHETHGERGVELFKKVQPDLLLLDIALPDTKGWKVLEKIKAFIQENTETNMPKVVIISAYGDPANRLMGKLQDVTRYLIKPFTPDEVENVVSGALGLNKDQTIELPSLSPDESIADVMSIIHAVRQQAETIQGVLQTPEDKSDQPKPDEAAKPAAPSKTEPDEKADDAKPPAT